MIAPKNMTAASSDPTKDAVALSELIIAPPPKEGGSSSESSSEKEKDGISSGTGIAEARFIDDVTSFVGKRDVKVAVHALQDLHAKYKYLDSSLATQKQHLKSKIPDIENAIDIVSFLQKKNEENPNQEMEVKYNLSENIYVSAEVPVNQGHILLWLGANCMLEYPIEDASSLLTNNLEAAKKQLEKVKGDACFVREQVTTTEVNIARVHNYGVMERQKQRAKEAEESAEGSKPEA